MNRSIPYYIFNVLLLVTLPGCNRNPLDVDISENTLQIDIQRFDREIFTLDFDTIDNAISSFYSKYEDFFDVYNVHVINIGPGSQKYYGSYLSMFVNDPTNKEVYNEAAFVFSDLAEKEDQLSDAFSRYLYHFPDSTVPQLVGFIGGFNHKLFTVGSYIGIGFDQYLGRDSRYYDLLETPEYLQYNQHPGKLVSDVVSVWGSAKYPYNDSVNNVLSHMIYGGLLLWFNDVMLPDEADSIKIGFSPEQMIWCKNNESQMWTYLVEHKLLFETDPLVIRKITDEAPYTYYFTSESPGRAAIWLGWQIVREYVARNPELTVPEIMAETDYQKVLRESKYHP